MGMVGHHALPELPASSQLDRLQTSGTPQGFVGILLGDRRRALHDVIAGTAVIYAWDARAARLRFLSRD